MGSISTVSSQTFKTYCFTAEKQGWKDGEDRRGEGEETKVRGPEWGAAEGRNGRRGNNAWWEEMERKGESSDRKQWGRKEKTMGVWRYGWVMWRKMKEEEETVERKGRGREWRKERCKCPRGEGEREHPSLACRCSVSHNFNFTLSSHSYSCPQPHFTHMQTSPHTFYWQSTNSLNRK